VALGAELLPPRAQEQLAPITKDIGTGTERALTDEQGLLLLDGFGGL
jgi:hypothetical protein